MIDIIHHLAVQLSTMKKSVGFKLSEEAKNLVEALADKLGISQSAVYEMAIRQLAEKERVK